MQTALLLFIVVMSLAIGFFVGLLLLSINSPLAKKITNTQPEENPEESAPASSPLPQTGDSLEEKKPTPDSTLLLTVWQQEGQPPVFEHNHTYYQKADLPPHLQNIITVQKDTDPVPPFEPEPIITKHDTKSPVDHRSDIEAEPFSVIGEIEAILQKKLANSPLAEKGIHLMENQNKEIRIWVGLDSYDSIDDIPDDDVRGLINAAVEEWELEHR